MIALGTFYIRGNWKVHIHVPAIRHGRRTSVERLFLDKINIIIRARERMHDARLIFVAFFVTYGINSCILARRLMHSSRRDGDFFLERVPSYSTRCTI